MPIPAIARQTMTPSGVRAKSAIPQALTKNAKKARAYDGLLAHEPLRKGDEAAQEERDAVAYAHHKAAERTGVRRRRLQGMV